MSVDPTLCSPRAQEDTRRLRKLITSPWLMVALAAAATALLAATGERIPIQQGTGWDGAVYARIAKLPAENMCRYGIDSYRLQRVLPSTLVNIALRSAGIPLTTANIVGAFAVYDWMLIVVSLVLLVAAGRRLAFGAAENWLLLLVTIGNFALAKQSFYYPVLTDVTAFALGCGMLYAWLSERLMLLIALTAIGSFAWPTIVVGGILLMLFPRPAQPTAGDGTRWPVVILAVGAYLVAFYEIVMVQGTYDLNQIIRVPIQIVHTWRSVLVLSLVVAASAIGVTVYSAGIDLEALWKEAKKVRIPVALAAAAVIFARWLILRECSTDAGSAPQGYFLKGLVILSVAKPFAFITSFVAYYGLAGLLLIVFWREFWQVLRQQGLGVRLWILLGLLTNFDLEARKSINSFPAVAFFLVEAARGSAVRWSWRSWTLVALIAVVFSKVWLTINQGAMEGRFEDYPFQYYFMNHGPWMSDRSYWWQSAAVVVGTAAVWWGLKRASRRAAAHSM